MSAPLTDQTLSSISSSGHVDGLGRRLLAFDRETGAILERLFLRPEIAAFETAIRERIDTLASLEDERFARPGSVERDPASGSLTVLSEFVAGSRLSDLLETAEEAGLVPGVDVALGFLLEALPALSSFHNATGCSHGLIAPARLILTPAGQVVFLDTAFGPIVERLALSRTRLWVELGVAAPQESGAARLDPASDISQVALSAVMLVIGRRLHDEEYPGSLTSLLSEVVDVAQIRGSSLFATSLQRLLQRALPLPGRRPFESADELAHEVRLLLRREIGVETCRQALLDFIEQMDAELPSGRSSGDVPYAGENGHGAMDLDDLSLEALDSIEVLDVEDDEERGSMQARDDDEASEDEGFEEIALEPDVIERSIEPPAPADDPVANRAADIGVPEAVPEKEISDPWSFDPNAAERVAGETTPPPSLEPPVESLPEPMERAPEPEAAIAAAPEEPIAEPAAAHADVQESETLPAEAPEEAELPISNSSRRKKRQHKSARARKDKLRSAAAPKPQPQPQVKAPEPKTQSGWLVNPDRAAAFDPPVPQPPAPQAPVMIGHAAPGPAPALQPVPMAPPPAPVQVAAPIVPAQPPASIPMPVYGAPSPAPPAPIAIRPAPAPQPKPVAPATTPVRVKAQHPSGYAPPRPAMPPPAVGYVERGTMFQAEEPRRFPWKLALIALVAVAVAIVVGRAYLPSQATTEEGEAAVDRTAPEQPAVVVMPKVETGHITIETQPAGARVMLDGKAVGQTPLKLADVPVGRHTLRLLSSSGEVTRTVRVEAGQTAVVDASIFSGWVAVYAPMVLDVAVGGRSIGTTERDRLMLSAGVHELTLTNRDLGYKTVQRVQVEPGEVRSITLDPRGPVNFNAVPWAEVWMDGKKLGDTPLANMQVPLGTREFVFRNPAYGERKVTATVRADQPTAIGVDFTRPQ